MTEIYSIGYGNLSIDEFIARVKSCGVGRIVDVRSAAWSHNEDFRRDELKARLEKEGIDYDYRGDVLGGRPYDKSFYTPDGRLDYGAYGASQSVQHALRDILTDAADGRRKRIALMCSELKPEACHRFLMIGQEAYRQGVDMRHITDIGTYRSHSDILKAVISPSLFDDNDPRKHSFVSKDVIECPDKSFYATAHESETEVSGGIIYESTDSRYAVRTKENAGWADLTVALAVDFNTPGETLTKNAAGENYLGIQLPYHDRDYTSPYVVTAIAERIASRLGEGPHKVNFAGNGIDSFTEKGIGQDVLDTFLSTVLCELKKRGVDMEVRSGGQTGVDEAAVKAARAAGYAWSVVCPKGFRMRDGKEHRWRDRKTGKIEVSLDVSDRKGFLARFEGEAPSPFDVDIQPTLDMFYSIHAGEKYQTLDRAFNAASEPHNGFRVVRYTFIPEGKDSPAVRYSYADMKGRLLSDFVFDEAKPFCNGMARVHTPEGYNFLTTGGSLMFDNPKAELGQFTRDGLAVIRMPEGYYNYIDRSGYLLNDEEYSKASDFSHGVARVEKDGKQFTVNAPWKEAAARRWDTGRKNNR